MASISLLAVGSRGDVQPYLALAAHLASGGHEVTLATHSPFQEMIEARNVRFANMPGDPRAIVSTPEAQDLLGLGTSLVRYIRRFARLLEPWWSELVVATTEAAADADVVVYSPLAFAGWHYAQARRVPSALGALQPFVATSEFPAVSLGGRNFGGSFNRLSHRLMFRMAWQALRNHVDSWRVSELGLPALGWRGPRPSLQDEPVLMAYSEQVVPRPADWEHHHHVTGYWHLDGDDREPDETLRAFLRASGPSVYVGFGSMADRDAERTTEIVLEAGAQADVALILASGWGGLKPGLESDRILSVGDLPHSSLFPLLSGVVHHGGAGTTGTAFRAGVPQQIIPFFADQPFWGHRVHQLGAGPPALRRRDLSPERLASGLRQLVRDDGISERARGLGTVIAAERGVERAAAVLEALL